jgi:uncharacterized protein YaiI (UPF0178 family)
MQIWIDADACPKVIKEIIFRAAMRTQTQATLVSNHPLQAPLSPFIKKLQVAHGFDVADDEIIKNIAQGDLVITADIPLADAVITRGATVLNPRGDVYTEHNIKHQLSIRNLHAELRSGGLITGGPPKLSNRESQTFANALDRFLTKGTRL